MTGRNYRRAEKACEICGERFTVPNYRKDIARFCSRSCRSAMIAAKYFNTGPKPWAAKNLDGHRHKSPTKFRPGHTAWNKDMKGIHLSPASEFQKGRECETRAETGEIRIRHFKNDNPRAFVKIGQPATWKSLAVYVWEQANGPLPRGMVVHHRDRNTLNDRIGNLQAMTRAEHIAEHRAEIFACRRVDEAARQPDLFVTPTPAPVQGGLEL